jgi:hypothetical protein
MMSLVHDTVAAPTSALAEQALLLQAWECVFSDHNAVYVSGPITTGPRFVKWYLASGRNISNTRKYRELHKLNVIQPNVNDLKEAANNLRKKLRDPVLNPGSIQIERWSQKDYNELWRKVIERFIKLVVLLPGWQYSVGSSYEALLGYMYNVEVSTPEGLKIDVNTAYRLIRDAQNQAVADHVPIQHEDLVRHMEKLVLKQT